MVQFCPGSWIYGVDWPCDVAPIRSSAATGNAWLVEINYPQPGSCSMKLKNAIVTSLLALAAISAASAVRAEDARLCVRHEVADDGVWGRVFDAVAPTQEKLGVIYSAVCQSADNINDVTVIRDSHSVAKAFAAPPELNAAMDKAGVNGAPQIWKATKSKK
jgi:hypothetical protein